MVYENYVNQYILGVRDSRANGSEDGNVIMSKEA